VNWLAAPAILAAAYYVLVIIAAIAWNRNRRGSASLPLHPIAVSILKPVHGRDPHFFEAIRSHAQQDYPEYEILFGVGDPNDPAITDIRRLIEEFPGREIRLIISSTKFPNAKVGVLADLAAQAHYPLLLINDSDIRVTPGYLHQAAAVLQQPGNGLVTCLYRARSDAWPGRWEALGVATEFAPSVLVARLLGSVEFALGSTMLLRAADLGRIGGFAAIGDYLADDYQLGLRIHNLGLRIAFAPAVVETHLGGETWAEAWRHQLRWSRSIRVSRPGGYCGYLVTQATFFSLIAILGGAWRAGVVTLAIRILAGIWTGWGVLRDRATVKYVCLTPFRDLWGFAIWVCGVFGSTVEWRGRRLKVTSNGKIFTDL
jgi:ceramide glucosyltransferase